MRNAGNEILVVAALLAAPQAAWGAGSCVAFVDDGVLVVECDDDDNSVVVTEVARGDFEVAGDDGTMINGMASETFRGVTDVSLHLGGGDDLSEVAEAEIPGHLSVDGGTGRNEFLLADSEVGAGVSVENDGSGETDFESSVIVGDLEISNGEGLDECKLDETEVVGSVIINNGEGDSLTGEGSETDVESESLVWGDLIVDNKDGVDELGIEEATVMGNVEINNHSGVGPFETASETSVEDDGFVGGDLIVINHNGFDEFDLEEAEVAGSIILINHNGGSGVDVEIAVVGGDLVVDDQNGFDEFNLDDTEIGGNVHVSASNGGSDFLTESSSGTGSVFIGGSLLIETGNGIDIVTLEVLEVAGTTTITTGPGNDVVGVFDSTFNEAFSADGHAGKGDVFTEAGSSFLGSFELRRFETVN